MIRGTSLAAHMLPVGLADPARRFERGGEAEYQFLWSAEDRLLPIWDNGRLRLATWACQRGESRWLPCCPATQLSTVEEGAWRPFRPRRVQVPCCLILEGGVWALVREGVEAILVRDERDIERVYLLVEAASHYWQIMTRGQWMPVLIGGERF